MTEAKLLRLIEGGENIQVEFKKSTTEITKDVYDTVCSFSNRDGGTIVLGVKDNGEILGIAPDAVDRMKKDFVTSINKLPSTTGRKSIRPCICGRKPALWRGVSCWSFKCRRAARSAATTGGFLTAAMKQI